MEILERVLTGGIRTQHHMVVEPLALRCFLVNDLVDLLFAQVPQLVKELALDPLPVAAGAESNVADGVLGLGWAGAVAGFKNHHHSPPLRRCATCATGY